MSLPGFLPAILWIFIGPAALLITCLILAWFRWLQRRHQAPHPLALKLAWWLLLACAFVPILAPFIAALWERDLMLIEELIWFFVAHIGLLGVGYLMKRTLATPQTPS